MIHLEKGFGTSCKNSWWQAKYCCIHRRCDFGKISNSLVRVFEKFIV